MFRKITIRRMPPATREYAKKVNELEKVLNYMKKNVETMQRNELAELALLQASKPKPVNEVKDSKDWIGDSLLAKVTREGR